MRKGLQTIGICSALLALPATSAYAQTSNWSAGVQPDLELTSHLSERLDIRFGVNREPTGIDPLERPAFAFGEESMRFSALVDWSVHQSGIRLTGGALYDDDLFASSDSLVPEFDRNDMSTYVGVGWDNDFGSEGRFGLSLDMGLTFEGVSEPLSLEPSLNQPKGDDSSLGNTFKSFQYTPSFSAGVEYRF